MDTLFVPLIHPSRMAAYAPGDFALSTAADGALEIAFTPAEREDLDVHLPAPAVIFLLPGGQTTALPGGPTVTPATDALAMQVMSTSLEAILGGARALSNPPPVFSPWWIVEGIEKNDFLQFVRSDRDEEERQALAKGYTRGTFRDALAAGVTSFNVSYKDAAGTLMTTPLAIATLTGRRGDPLTVRLSTCYAWDLPPVQYSTMPPSSSLTTIGLLNTALEHHPLVERAATSLLEGDLAFHVAFQYWEPFDPPAPGIGSAGNKGAFAPMPAGTTVRLMKVDPANPGGRVEVASGTLGAAGRLQFDSGATAPQSLPRSALALSAGQVLAFQVESPRAFVRQYQRDGSPRAAAGGFEYLTGGTSQAIWLTAGLSSTTGEAGSLEGLDSYPAASFGLPSAPIVYNAGIPVFLQIEYVRLLANAGAYARVYEPAPKGVLVTVTNSNEWDLGEFYTDEHGQIVGQLTRWNPAYPDIRVLVSYRMEDRPPAGSFYPLGLPRIDGVVQSADSPTAAHEEYFDSSWTNPQASGARTTFGFAGAFSGSSLGTPPAGAGPGGLEIVQVGAIDISWVGPGDWRYDSGSLPASGRRLYGEHGGVLDAFKALRHAHEWWHNLTSSAAGASADTRLQRPWRDLFDALHRPGLADPGLIVRVIHDADVRIRGGASVVAGTDRFELKLFHPGSWTTLKQTLDNDRLSPEALVLLWNRPTIHHEFAHIVLLVATEMNGANSAALAAAVYNPAYDPLQVQLETFTPLLEGVSYFTTIAVGSANRTFVGATFAVEAASGTAVVANVQGQVPLGLLLSAGKARSDGTLDPRLGLFVPGALARAFSDFMAPILPAIPDPAHPDLKDDLNAITNPDVQRTFQRVVWLPMLGLGQPDAAGRWDDFDGARVAYPTTVSLMKRLATHPDCYPALPTPADKTRARGAFGTAPTAWFLWDAWPP